MQVQIHLHTPAAGAKPVGGPPPGRWALDNRQLILDQASGGWNTPFRHLP